MSHYHDLYGRCLSLPDRLLRGLSTALPVLGRAKGLGGATRACFVAGTLVTMADGTSKPIEQVKAGEQVLSKNEQTGQVQARSVSQTSVRTVPSVLSLTLGDAETKQVVETITTTDEHPFYVQGKGFVAAGSLGIGNSIVTRAGPALIVKSVERQEQASGYTVYNFIVEDDHTYFVGNVAGGVWVHNIDCVGYAKRFMRKLKGEMWEMTPKSGKYLQRAHDPFEGPMDTDFPDQFEGWNNHVVHVKDGMVRDPMMLGHHDPIPLEEWMKHWNNWADHNFRRF